MRTKHGGNRILVDLLANDLERHKKFQFSILHILPGYSLRQEVICLEQITKAKLGPSASGLNTN